MEGNTGITTIVTAMGTLTQIMGEVFSVMTGNPLLVVFLAGSLFSLGIKLFRKAKSAAKG